jgi:hypothetical protein
MSPSRRRTRYYGEYEMCEREAAEFLGLSRRELVALCERGEGPYHVFIGGRALLAEGPNSIL